MGALDLNAMNEQREAQGVQGEDVSPLQQEYNKVWGGAVPVTKKQSGEEVQQIALSQIKPFRNKKGKKQPFKINKEKIAQIKASAKDIGIITPIIVRPWLSPEGENCYQILSGHHRFKVAQELGYTTIACIVRNITDDECEKYVVEANIQRVRLLPTEYGSIFERYMDMRGDLDVTADEIAEKFGVSKKSLYRYMNVVKCSEDLQNLMDAETVSPDCADILCGLDSDKQAEVVAYVTESGKKLNLNGLKKYLNGEGNKPKEKKYTNKKYKDYSKRYGFTVENFSEEELDTVVDLALEQYFNEHGFTEKKDTPETDGNETA